MDLRTQLGVAVRPGDASAVGSDRIRSDRLIDELINSCADSAHEGRLDTAIDVLSQLGEELLRYATEYLINDSKSWNLLYPTRAYKPNDDYWHILLRAIGQLQVVSHERVRFVRMCMNASSRYISESVLLALGDIGTTDAKIEIRKFLSNDDPFIAELAEEILE